jgi:hypothetical protein
MRPIFLGVDWLNFLIASCVGRTTTAHRLFCKIFARLAVSRNSLTMVPIFCFEDRSGVSSASPDVIKRCIFSDHVPTAAISTDSDSVTSSALTTETSAVLERDLAVERGRDTKHDRALHLRLHDIGIHHSAAAQSRLRAPARPTCASVSVRQRAQVRVQGLCVSEHAR